MQNHGETSFAKTIMFINIIHSRISSQVYTLCFSSILADWQWINQIDEPEDKGKWRKTTGTWNPSSHTIVLMTQLSKAVWIWGYCCRCGADEKNRWAYQRSLFGIAKWINWWINPVNQHYFFTPVFLDSWITENWMPLQLWRILLYLVRQNDSNSKQTWSIFPQPVLMWENLEKRE